MVFFGYLLYLFVFPKVFLVFLKTLGKTQKTKKTNPYPRVGLKLLNSCCFGFPDGFFCVILHFWFSRRFFFVFKKPSGKPKQQTNPYPRVGLKPLKLCFFVFPKVFVVFFGFLWYFWFSRRFFKVVSMLRF